MDVRTRRRRDGRRDCGGRSVSILDRYGLDPGGCLVARLDRLGAGHDDDDLPLPPVLTAGEVWAPQISMTGVPLDVTRDERTDS